MLQVQQPNGTIDLEPWAQGQTTGFVAAEGSDITGTVNIYYSTYSNNPDLGHAQANVAAWSNNGFGWPEYGRAARQILNNLGGNNQGSRLAWLRVNITLDLAHELLDHALPLASHPNPQQPPGVIPPHGGHNTQVGGRARRIHGEAANIAVTEVLQQNP